MDHFVNISSCVRKSPHHVDGKEDRRSLSEVNRQETQVLLFSFIYYLILVFLCMSVHAHVHAGIPVFSPRGQKQGIRYPPLSPTLSL